MTRKRLSSKAVQYILDLPSGSEMSNLHDEFSEDEIGLDMCNTNVVNTEEDEEEDIDNNNNDEDLEVRNNESNEGHEGDDGDEEQNNNDEVNLEIKRIMNKVKNFLK